MRKSDSWRSRQERSSHRRPPPLVDHRKVGTTARPTGRGRPTASSKVATVVAAHRADNHGHPDWSDHDQVEQPAGEDADLYRVPK